MIATEAQAKPAACVAGGSELGRFNCIEIHTKLGNHLSEVLHNPDIDEWTTNFQLKVTRCPLCEQHLSPMSMVQ